MLNTVESMCKRLDDCRLLVDASSGVVASATRDDRVKLALRASTFVLAAAAIEEFFRGFVRELAETVTLSSMTLADVATPIHAVHLAKAFRALQDLRDPEKLWPVRVQVVSSHLDATRCALDIQEDELWLKGATTRPQHVHTVWMLFCLSGQPFSALRQEVAMRAIADRRNGIAHGELDPMALATDSEARPEILKDRLRAIEDWAFHCWESLQDYRSAKPFAA
ncbi:MAG: hypothetical protein AB1416_06365 [Actinomycetota bacterium]